MSRATWIRFTPVVALCFALVACSETVGPKAVGGAAAGAAAGGLIGAAAGGGTAGIIGGVLVIGLLGRILPLIPGVDQDMQLVIRGIIFILVVAISTGYQRKAGRSDA